MNSHSSKPSIPVGETIIDYKDFEAMTAALYQALGEGSGIQIKGYGAACRVQGKSGTWYQIDVLAEQSNGLQTVKTGIECKYWQSKVNRDVVSKLVTTINDTNLDKGAIVSKEGFTSEAIKLARQENIGLVEMREPNDADWEGKFKTIHITMCYAFPEFYDIEFVQHIPTVGETIRFTGTGQEITIIEPQQEPKTLDQIINQAVDSSLPPHEINEVNFPPGTTLRVQNIDKSAAIDAIRFRAQYHTLEEEIVIDGTKVIRLIVKELFENRQFHIDDTGRITETITAEDTASP